MQIAYSLREGLGLFKDAVIDIAAKKYQYRSYSSDK